MVLFPCRLSAAWRAVAPVRYGSRTPGRTRDLCNRKRWKSRAPISIASLNGTSAFCPSQHHRTAAIQCHRLSGLLRHRGETFMR